MPSKYDLRDHIKIGIESQSPSGLCYAYATLTSVETNMTLHLKSVTDKELQKVIGEMRKTTAKFYVMRTVRLPSITGSIKEDSSQKEKVQNNRNIYYVIKQKD